MEAGILLKETNPLGGWEKVGAIYDSLKKTGLTISEVMYIGDSITDLEALSVVKEKGGLAVAFNGNRYAIEAAEICCISPHTLPISTLGSLFLKAGKEGVIKVVDNWEDPYILSSSVEKTLIDELNLVYKGDLPKVCLVSSENREGLIKESEQFRRTLRGEEVGRLG